MNIETANRLLKYRKKHNLSQEELAAKIGVSRQAISKWERAEASPDTDNLILLAKLYGVTLDELLMSDGDEADDKADECQRSSETVDTSEGCNNADNKSTSCKTEINFKNGIHIHSNDGDNVDIGFNGIHVNDKDGTNVKIDGSKIFVKSTDAYSSSSEENPSDNYNNDNKDKSKWYMLPYPIIAVAAFLIWGFCGGWAISWIVFLTVPLYYTLIDAITKRNPKVFAFPVLVVTVYLWLGLTMGLWHPCWILFLTVPVYYCICDMFKKSKK